MPYGHATFGDLKSQLARRLSDPSKVFWLDDELGRIIVESLRTYGVLSGFWRDRGTLSTISGTAWYDVQSLINGGGTSVYASTVTDRDLIKDIQYALLEPATDQTTWNGTAQFVYDDVVRAIERRRDQFLVDTGIIVSRSLMPVAPPPIGRVSLADTIIDVRRAAWLDFYLRWHHLWREDETAAGYADTGWSVNADTPSAYSVMAPPPVTLQLMPPPLAAGQLELLTVDAGASLDPAVAASTLGIPDDLTPFIKWGALADLLGKDGPASDPARSAFSEQRYRQGVLIARSLAAVVQGEINGAVTIPGSLADLDAGVLDWQNRSGAPTDLALASWNLMALHPVPDGVYSVTCDCVANAAIPAIDADHVQLGREQLDALLDYSEHLAAFKMGGAEFAATERQATNFLQSAVNSNQRLAASARYVFTPRTESQREKRVRPRRTAAQGLGVVTEEAR